MSQNELIAALEAAKAENAKLTAALAAKPAQGSVRLSTSEKSVGYIIVPVRKGWPLCLSREQAEDVVRQVKAIEALIPTAAYKRSKE